MQDQIAKLNDQVASLTEANGKHEKNATASKAEVTGLQELLQNSNFAIEEARQTAVELSSELEMAKEEVRESDEQTARGVKSRSATNIASSLLLLCSFSARLPPPAKSATSEATS